MSSVTQPDNGFSITFNMWKWRLAAFLLVPWIQLSLAVPLAVVGWRAGASRPWVLAFLGIIGLLTLIEALSIRGPWLTHILAFGMRHTTRWWVRPNATPAGDPSALSLNPSPPLAAWHKPLSFSLPLAVLLLTWITAVLAARLSDSPPTFYTLIILILGYAVVPLVRVLVARLNSKHSFHQQFSFWLCVIGSVLAAVALTAFTQDTWTFLAVVAYFAILYTATYATLRLWTGERGWNEILNELSRLFLEECYSGDNFNAMASEIGRRLRHVRVAILVPDGTDHLLVSGSYGHSQAAATQRVPIGDSLTGLAYTSRAPAGCNDVDACAAYIPSDNERTRAELAVPIMYRGEVFAVLDVQSPAVGVFDFPDVRTLETIARVIGATLAANRQNRSYEVATDIWAEVVSKTGYETANDAALFERFAAAAREMLGADLITFYPLTLSGRPRVEPFFSGDFKVLEKLRGAPTPEADDVLIPLIAEWQPLFASNIETEPRFLGKQRPGRPGFVRREGVRSACFLPVGTRQERLGALFLSFRKPTEFDAMRKFKALALAQAYTVAASQNRYRTGYHHGFGRPEMNLHNVVGRHGFSYGSHSASKLAGDILKNYHARQDRVCVDGDCALMPLVTQMDDLIVELSTLEAARPPAFHKSNLSQHLKIYIASLPQTASGRAPAITYAIAPPVDALNPLLKIAIYRFITEGISNALLYAEARTIQVAAEHRVTDIFIRITNDGRPLPSDAEQRRSAYGIYFLLDKFREELGADGDLVATPDGSLLTLSIPCLP